MTDYLETPEGRRIAYAQSKGKGPGVYVVNKARESMPAFLRLFC